MWGNVSHDVGEARERELASKFLKPALDKGAVMVRNHNTEQSAHDVIRRIMNNHPVVLQIQRELVDEHKDVANTAAGGGNQCRTRRRGEATRGRFEESAGGDGTSVEGEGGGDEAEDCRRRRGSGRKR
jgi:hypothetical protein